jgi:hypothetical protein
MEDTVVRVDNLQAGDLILFIEGEDLSGPLPDTMGLVVELETGFNDEQAVLIQFYAGCDYQAGPLHYYHRELDTFLEQGSIRIVHAS